MKSEQYLPTLLMAIDIAAGIVYLVRGNLRLFVYWSRLRLSPLA